MVTTRRKLGVVDGHPGGGSAPKQKHLLTYGNSSTMGDCRSSRITAIHPWKTGIIFNIIPQIVITDG